jgi:limonene-1,2-epoxide hydrolase
MRTLAQATAAAGPAVRALWTGDPFSQNIPSIAMTMRHLWVSGSVRKRHTDRLVAFSRRDSEDAIREFEAATGVQINPALALIEGDKSMPQLLDDRLSKAGCVSTRVRVLASRHPDEMEAIITHIEKLAEAVQGDDTMEEAFDAICVTWYLSDTTDDVEALNQLKADIARLQKKLE